MSSVPQQPRRGIIPNMRPGRSPKYLQTKIPPVHEPTTPYQIEVLYNMTPEDLRLMPHETILQAVMEAWYLYQAHRDPRVKAWYQMCVAKLYAETKARFHVER
jgi:hypothetical protein